MPKTIRFSAIFLATALVAAMVALPSAQAQMPEQISDFHADIEVLPNGLIEVTETIQYFFPGQRHGIYRELPYTYSDGKSTWKIPLDIHGITDKEGVSRPYSISKTQHGLNLKIGDPDRTIQGSHTYVIDYGASGALRYFDDHDELYWNVTGTEWQVPIAKSSATVILPEGVDVKAVVCYTGERGSKSQACQADYSDNKATFSASGNLTVVVGWPTGLVAEVQPEKAVNWLMLLPFLLPLLMFLVMYAIWRRHGRDAPVSPTLVVQYEPPGKMRPAEIGTLMDGSADIRDISAIIVDLAVRGYLKIKETEKKGLLFNSKDHELELLQPFFRQDAELKSYEVEVLIAIFNLGNKVRISRLKDDHAFVGHLKDIKNKLGAQLVLDGHFAANPIRTRAKWMAAISVIVIVGYFLGGPALGVLAASGLPIPLIVGSAILTVAIFAFFAWHMPKMTPAGAAAFGHAQGFKEYLSRAEKYRLEWQEKEKVFETFLPYAMVFKVVDKWTRAFEGLSIEQPDWYEGTAFRQGVFNAAIFNSTFSGFDSAMRSAVTSRPSQSGGGSGLSGGGFSGGGGGGGGGGSW